MTDVQQVTENLHNNIFIQLDTRTIKYMSTVVTKDKEKLYRKCCQLKTDNLDHVMKENLMHSSLPQSMIQGQTHGREYGNV